MLDMTLASNNVNDIFDGKKRRKSMNEENNLSLNVRVPNNNIPNPVMLARQIDSLREVMRRMQIPESELFDSLVAKKLENFPQA
jgi:hypothetical protein